MSIDQEKSDVEQISILILSGKQLLTTDLITKSGHRVTSLYKWNRDVINYFKTSQYRNQIPKFMRLTRDHEEENWENGHHSEGVISDPRLYDIRLECNRQALQDCIKFLEDLIK